MTLYKSLWQRSFCSTCPSPSFVVAQVPGTEAGLPLVFGSRDVRAGSPRLPLYPQQEKQASLHFSPQDIAPAALGCLRAKWLGFSVLVKETDHLTPSQAVLLCAN